MPRKVLPRVRAPPHADGPDAAGMCSSAQYFDALGKALSASGFAEALQTDLSNRIGIDESHSRKLTQASTDRPQPAVLLAAQALA